MAQSLNIDPLVSTLSRLKAAGHRLLNIATNQQVSTLSRLKAAGSV